MAAVEGQGRLDICAVQLITNDCTTAAERDENLVAACEAIESASKARERQASHVLFVLPELSTSGYNPKTFEALEVLAEPLHGPSFRKFGALAASLNAYISYGFPRRIQEASSRFTICNGVPQGELLQWYDKLHLCNYGDCSESTWFSRPVEERCSLFSINGVTIGLTICYDIRFPELYRRLALDGGADVILHPGGWPKDCGFFTWHPFVITRAVENQVLIVSVNRAGAHFGRSIIAGPWIDASVGPVLLGDDPENHWVTFDKQRVEEVRDAYRLRGDRLSNSTYAALPICSFGAS